MRSATVEGMARKKMKTATAKKTAKTATRQKSRRGRPPNGSVTVVVHEDSFAYRLRELRIKRKMVQSELADAIGCHVTQINRYERGRSQPSAKAVKGLADALGVSTAELIEGTTGNVAQKRLSDHELLSKFEEVAKLPDGDRALVNEVLDCVLLRNRVKSLSL